MFSDSGQVLKEERADSTYQQETEKSREIQGLQPAQVEDGIY